MPSANPEVACALTKLASTTGMAMAKYIGKADAANQLRACADHVESNR